MCLVSWFLLYSCAFSASFASLSSAAGAPQNSVLDPPLSVSQGDLTHIHPMASFKIYVPIIPTFRFPDTPLF